MTVMTPACVPMLCEDVLSCAMFCSFSMLISLPRCILLVPLVTLMCSHDHVPLLARLIIALVFLLWLASCLIQYAHVVRFPVCPGSLGLFC